MLNSNGFSPLLRVVLLRTHFSFFGFAGLITLVAISSLNKKNEKSQRIPKPVQTAI